MPPVSFAAVTPTNMQLTPMRVNFKGVDLGGTLGNVVIKPEFQKADIKADQFGESVLDRRVSSLMCTVVTELTEVTLKDNWKVVFPHAKLVTSGGNKLIYFQSMIGDGDLANAGPMILHPLALADADLSQDFKFFNAIASAVSEITYGPKTQSVLKVTWNILLDTTVSPARFLTYGDPAVGLVAAVAGSPVFTGTGNGTMTGVSVFSGFTKTETVTAKCVTPQSNAGIFEVHGSVSGPMGLATVGVGFVAPGGQIAFTINDGTSDFILNDQFTVATTAANYA